MNNKLEHAPAIMKNLGDASAGLSVAVTWMVSVTPFLNFCVVLLAIFWGVYRIHDMRLSVKIKQQQLSEYERKEK